MEQSPTERLVKHLNEYLDECTSTRRWWLMRWSRSLSDSWRSWVSVVALGILGAGLVSAIRSAPVLTASAMVLFLAVFYVLFAGAPATGRWMGVVNQVVPRMGTTMLVVALISGWLLLAIAASIALTWTDPDGASVASVVFAGAAGTGMLLASSSYTRSPVDIDDERARLFHAGAPDTCIRLSLLVALWVVLAVEVRDEHLDIGPALSAGVAILGILGVGLTRAVVRRRRLMSTMVIAADGVLAALMNSSSQASVLEAALSLDRASRTRVNGLLGTAIPCASPRTTAALDAYLSVVVGHADRFQSDDQVVQRMHRELSELRPAVVRAEFLELCLLMRRRASRYTDVCA